MNTIQVQTSPTEPADPPCRDTPEPPLRSGTSSVRPAARRPQILINYELQQQINGVLSAMTGRVWGAGGRRSDGGSGES